MPRRGSPKTEAQKRTKYIVTVWFRWVAMPIAALEVASLIWDNGLSIHEIISTRFLLSAAIVVAACFGLSYVVGRAFWKWGVAFDVDKDA